MKTLQTLILINDFQVEFIYTECEDDTKPSNIHVESSDFDYSQLRLCEDEIDCFDFAREIYAAIHGTRGTNSDIKQIARVVESVAL